MHTITIRTVGLGILLSAAVPTWAHACNEDIARFTISVCERYPIQCQSAHRCLDAAAKAARKLAPVGTAQAPGWTHTCNTNPVRLKAALCSEYPNSCETFFRSVPTAKPAARTPSRVPAPASDPCETDIERLAAHYCGEYPRECQKAWAAKLPKSTPGTTLELTSRGRELLPRTIETYPPSPYEPSRATSSPATSDPVNTMVYGCASAAGIDPQGSINTSQMRALTSCVDRRIRR